MPDRSAASPQPWTTASPATALPAASKVRSSFASGPPQWPGCPPAKSAWNALRGRECTHLGQCDKNGRRPGDDRVPTVRQPVRLQDRTPVFPVDTTRPQLQGILLALLSPGTGGLDQVL